MGDCEYEDHQAYSVGFYDNIMSKPANTKKSSFLRILVVLLVFLSLGLSIVTFIIAINKGTGEEMQTCMPCCNIQHDAMNSTEFSKLYDSLERHTDEENVLQCCAKTAEQKKAFTKMVLKILSKKLSPIHPPAPIAASLIASPKAAGLKGTFGSSLAYAQKILQINSSNIPDTNYITLVIDPDYTSGRHELAEGVELRKEGIIVKQPGLYFVYKSIYFYPHSVEPCFARQSLESVLMRRTGDVTNDLIRSVHTCCPDCVLESETGFAGGVFQLDEGDLIQVKVNAAGIIHISHDVTFVGLMMMGGRMN